MWNWCEAAQRNSMQLSVYMACSEWHDLHLVLFHMNIVACSAGCYKVTMKIIFSVIYHVTALNQVITLQLCCYFRYRSSLVVWILLWVTAPTLAAWWIFFKSNFILVSYKFISFYFNYTFRVLCHTMV